MDALDKKERHNLYLIIAVTIITVIMLGVAWQYFIVDLYRYQVELLANPAVTYRYINQYGHPMVEIRADPGNLIPLSRLIWTQERIRCLICNIVATLLVIAFCFYVWRFLNQQLQYTPRYRRRRRKHQAPHFR